MRRRTAPRQDERRASSSRRASISSRSVAIRASGGARRAVRDLLGIGRLRHAPFRSAATADSELASTASRSSAAATGSQRVASSATRRSEKMPTRQPSRQLAHRRRRSSTPATAIASTEHCVVRAHDRRERATTVLIGRSALHEEPVADDRGSVARRPADDEGDRKPDRAAERGAPQPTPISAIEPT